MLVALSMLVAIGAAAAGGLLLHRAALLERQTLRTQMLGGLAFKLQDFELRAETETGALRALRAERADALLAANAAMASVVAHDPATGSDIRPWYVAYVRSSTRAFRQAAAHGGVIPLELQQGVERRLAEVEARVDAEVRDQARQTRVTNPRARLALIVAAVAVGLLVLLLLWQYDMQRRAGRIDRDDARRADELMRMKDDFAAAVSHELRTPLTSILGYLELLQESVEQRSEEDEAYLAVVQRNAERLLRLVSDLLLVAEVEDSVLALQFEEVDLRDLARECVQAAKPAADRKHIRLELESKGPEIMHGDGVRIAQMMDNLVSNAIKFTPEGGRVTLSTSSRDGDAVVEVVDSGVGISAEDQLQLYDRFFRTHEAAVHATPGTGLGLTITKAIVDAHGGSIEVRSTVGVGTTFIVTLPRVRVAANELAPIRSDA